MLFCVTYLLIIAGNLGKTHLKSHSDTITKW